MKRAKVVAIAVVVMCSATSACYKIKSAGFILRGNTASLPGISEGGKVRWVSMEAQDFVVHIDPVSPCSGGANDLAGTSSVHRGTTMIEAGCTIAKGMDGYYTYSILVHKAGGDAAAGSAASGARNIPFHVDYCPLCPPNGASKLKKLPPRPVDGSPNGGPDILFGCDQRGGLYTLDPTPSVYPGQVVLWSPLGPESGTKWQASFMPPFCKGDRQSLGTIVEGSPLACTVPEDAKIGLVSYRLEYKGAQSCSGQSSISVVSSRP